MIFPIADLNFVVPPILHIHFSIVLGLYQDLESCCKVLDGKEENMESSNLALEQLSQDIKSLSSKLLSIQKEMIEVSSSIIDLKNIEVRYPLILGQKDTKKLGERLKKERKFKSVSRLNVLFPDMIVTEGGLNVASAVVGHTLFVKACVIGKLI